MKKPYFVMLRHPNGEYFLPLVDDNYELLQFESIGLAKSCAESSSLGHEFGYEIFNFFDGV